jgi:hypothetical protein
LFIILHTKASEAGRRKKGLVVSERQAAYSRTVQVSHRNRRCMHTVRSCFLPSPLLDLCLFSASTQSRIARIDPACTLPSWLAFLQFRVAMLHSPCLPGGHLSPGSYLPYPPIHHSFISLNSPTGKRKEEKQRKQIELFLNEVSRLLLLQIA